MSAKKKTEPAVVRRRSEDRKGLSPELEGLARGDETRVRTPRHRGPRLKDPRGAAGVLVPGVANRDARAVADARIEALDALDGEARARLAAEAMLLRIWRGRSITSMESLALDFLDVEPQVFREWAEEGAAMLGVPLEPLSEEAVALWFRAESAALEDSLPLEIGVRLDEHGEHLSFEVKVGRGAAALRAVGRRVAPLAQDHERPREDGREARDSRGPGPGRGPGRDRGPGFERGPGGHGPGRGRGPRSDD